MEELKDASIHHTAMKITDLIKSMKNYETIFQTVQRLVCSPEVDKNDMRNTLEEAVKCAGLETEIRNLVYQLVRSSLKEKEQDKEIPTTGDPLSYLKRAGAQWDRRVRKSLNAMCVELSIPLQGTPRTVTDREEFQNKWEELSNYAIDLSNYRPVYAPKDLLEVLISLKGPSSSKPNENTEFVETPKWEFSHISLKVKNIMGLRTLYSELLKSEPLPSTSTGIGPTLSQQYQRVLNTRLAPLCQQLLKKGNTLIEYRGALWSFVLGSNPLSKFNLDHWYQLKSNVLAVDHIVDKLVFKDIQLTASNDDQYFVFEDVLYQIMLCFSRDKEIAELIQYENYPVKGKQYEGPPSGVVPFHGICMFAAPFCYLYDSPISLYFTFRSFYIRYCHRLITINTHPQGIVSLCLLFEKLFQTHEPELWCHLRDLEIQPIRVVFKWLMRAFSGHLPPDQLLILWDLILGFDSLEILSLFSIIILSFRRDSIMQVNSLDAIEAILADLTSIKVLPLLQLALARD